jgi:N-acylneuraminate cytidylyltransferase
MRKTTVSPATTARDLNIAIASSSKKLRTASPARGTKQTKQTSSEQDTLHASRGEHVTMAFIYNCFAAPPRPHALILARGGSKGIPRKNIKPMNGVPLLVYNVKAALASHAFEKVIVSSDDSEILEIAVKAGAVAHRRSAESAKDTASSESGIFDYVDSVPGLVNCALIQCTSPLTTSDDFRNGVARFHASGADSLVTVVRAHRFLWEVKDGRAQPKNYDPVHRPRRQDWAGELIENGAFYVFKAEALRTSGSRLSGKIEAFEMSEDTMAEIDTPTDWAIIEGLVAAKFGKVPQTWGF